MTTQAPTLPPLENETIDAFLLTEYRVMIDCGLTECTASVFIGAPCPVLQARLGGRAWCIITPFNPGARASGPAENIAAMQKLELQLRNINPDSMFRSVNRDPSGEWPDEPGWLFTWNEPRQVHDLAAEFGQLGVVCAEGGRTPELWLYQPIRLDPGAAHIRVIHE